MAEGGPSLVVEGTPSMVAEVQNTKRWLQDQIQVLDRLQTDTADTDQKNATRLFKEVDDSITQRRARIEWLIDSAQTTVLSRDHADPQLDLELAGLEYQWSYLSDKLFRLHRHNRSKTEKVNFVYIHKKFPVSKLHRTFPIYRERPLCVNLENGKTALKTRGRAHVTKLSVPFRVHVKSKVKRHPRWNNLQYSSQTSSVTSYDQSSITSGFDQSEPPCATSTPVPNPVITERQCTKTVLKSSGTITMAEKGSKEEPLQNNEKSFHLYMAASRDTASGLSPMSSFPDSPAVPKRKRLDSDNADLSFNTSASVSLNSPCLSPRTPQRPSLNRLSLCSDSDSYMSSPQASPGVGLKKRDVKGHYKKDELWQAIQSDYQYLMDEEIIETCKSTESDLSMEDDDLGNSKVTFTDFIQQYKELTDWLNQIQLHTERQGASLSEKYLNQKYYEEMLQRSPRRKLFNDYAKQLMRRYPNMKEEIQIRIQHLNNQWGALESAISPKRASNDEDTMMKDLEADLNSLRSWLHGVEGRLLPLCLRPSWTLQELEERLKSHKDLQLDIESHSKIVSAVLKLCERLQSDKHADDSEDDREAFQLVAINLERRWHTIWLQSLEWQCRLEEAIGRRKGLYNVNSARSSWSDLSYKTAASREHAQEHTHDVEDSERSDINDTYEDDTGSDDLANSSDVIPFSEHEYQKINSSLNGSDFGSTEFGSLTEQERLDNQLDSLKFPLLMSSTPKVDRSKLKLDTSSDLQPPSERVTLKVKVEHTREETSQKESYFEQRGSVECRDVGYSSGSPSNEEVDNVISTSCNNCNNTSLEVNVNDSVLTNVTSLSESNFTWDKSSRDEGSSTSMSTVENSSPCARSPELSGPKDNGGPDNLDREVSDYKSIISSPTKNFYKMTSLDSELISPVDRSEELKVKDELEAIIRSHHRVEATLDTAEIHCLRTTHLQRFDNDLPEEVSGENGAPSATHESVELVAQLDPLAVPSDSPFLRPGDQIVINRTEAPSSPKRNDTLLEQENISITTVSICDSPTKEVNNVDPILLEDRKAHHVATGYGVIQPVVTSVMVGPGRVGDDSVCPLPDEPADEMLSTKVDKTVIPPCSSCYETPALSMEDLTSLATVTDLNKGYEPVTETVISTPGGDAIYVELSSRSTSVERDLDIAEEEEFQTSRIHIIDSRSSSEHSVNAYVTEVKRSKVTITHSSRPMSEAPSELITSELSVSVPTTADLEVDHPSKNDTFNMKCVTKTDFHVPGRRLSTDEEENIHNVSRSPQSTIIKVQPKHSAKHQVPVVKEKPVFKSTFSYDPVSDWLESHKLPSSPVKNQVLQVNGNDVSRKPNDEDLTVDPNTCSEPAHASSLNASQSRLDYIAHNLDYRLDQCEFPVTASQMLLPPTSVPAVSTTHDVVDGSVVLQPPVEDRAPEQRHVKSPDSIQRLIREAELLVRDEDVMRNYPSSPSSENTQEQLSPVDKRVLGQDLVYGQTQQDSIPTLGVNDDSMPVRSDTYARSMTKSSINSDISLHSDTGVDEESCDASSEYTSESEGEADQYCSVLTLNRQSSGEKPFLSQNGEENIAAPETVTMRPNKPFWDSSRETTPEVSSRAHNKPRSKQTSASGNTDPREKTPSDEDTVLSSCDENPVPELDVNEVDKWLESVDKGELVTEAGNVSDDTDELLTSTLESFSETAWDGYQAPPYASVDDDEEKLEDGNLQWDDEYQFKDSGVYSGGFAQQPISNAEAGTASSNGYTADASKVEDSDSDLEDLHHVISETNTAMKITETSLKRHRKDDLGLGISLDPSIYAEHVATCQTNIKCLEDICEQLESEAGLPNLSDVDLQEIEDTIKKWTVLHELATHRQKQSQQLRQIYKEIVEIRRSLKDVEEEINDNSFDGFLDLERSIQYLQKSKLQFTTINTKLTSTSEEVHAFGRENSDVKLVKVHDEIRTLTMHWQVIIERTNTRISELQLVLISWYDYSETQKELTYLLKQDRRQLCLTELTLDIGVMSQQDGVDIQHDLRVMMHDFQIYENKLRCLRQDASNICAVMNADTQQEITAKLAECGNELNAVKVKGQQLLNTLDKTVTRHSGTAAGSCAVEEPVDRNMAGIGSLLLKDEEMVVGKDSVDGLVEQVDQRHMHLLSGVELRDSVCTSGAVEGCEDGVAMVTSSTVVKSGHRRGLCLRVCCMALPVYLLLVLLIAFGLLLTPDCCERWDTYSLEFTPRLRYVNGAPPV